MLVLLGVERRSLTKVRWFVKPLASIAFLLVALVSGGLGSIYGGCIATGLFLSLLGDVFLIPRGARAWFLAGLAAFLLAHVAYCVAFLAGGVSWGTVGAVLGPLLFLAWMIGKWLLPAVSDSMRGPVGAYIVVISLMGLLAAGHGGQGGSLLVLGAAVLFFLSDISVAIDRFKEGGFGNRLWGLPAYYVAQLLFAWTLLPGLT